MLSLKSFIHDHIPLQGAQLLDAHMQYAKVGVPLADRDDLYRTQSNGNVGYDTPEGRVIYDLQHKTVDHVDNDFNSHRLDGPSVLNHQTGYRSWRKRSVPIAKFIPHTESYSGLGSPGTHFKNMNIGGVQTNYEVCTPAAFNTHLAKHGYPAFDYKKD